MMKYVNYFIRYILVFLVLFSYIINYIPVEAASQVSEKTTLKDLKDELTRLKNKKAENDKQKSMSQAEKNAKNQGIANAHKEIENAEKKVLEAKAKIEESNKKISEVKKQSEELMKYYQQISSNNTYLEFITESSSMTDLIMRIDAVNQIVDYNQRKLEELDALIIENQELQVEMKKYETEQENKITQYESRIKEIDSSLLALSDIGMDLNTEIKTQTELIKMYEGMNCKDSDILVVCSSNANNNGWLKPVVKGSINSLFGYRNLNGSTGFHSGIDIGVAEGTTVYSATNGIVVSIVNRSSCGGNQVYIQSNVKGKPYTMLYAHLLSINVKMGQQVTDQTVIGKSGGYSTGKNHGGYDGCTFGAHLHYSVSQTNYISWSTFMAHLINPPGFPGKGAWFYSRTQWFG